MNFEYVPYYIDNTFSSFLFKEVAQDTKRLIADFNNDLKTSFCTDVVKTAGQGIICDCLILWYASVV